MNNQTSVNSPIPLVAYYATNEKRKLCLCLRFNSIVGARRGVRAILKRLLGHGIGCTVVYNKNEEFSGGYDVDIEFCRENDEERVNSALVQPPSSNRGVTKW